MAALYTFGDNITHYKTKSVHCWGLMNSATKSDEETTKALVPQSDKRSGLVPLGSAPATAET